MAKYILGEKHWVSLLELLRFWVKINWLGKEETKVEATKGPKWRESAGKYLDLKPTSFFYQIHPGDKLYALSKNSIEHLHRVGKTFIDDAKSRDYKNFEDLKQKFETIDKFLTEQMSEKQMFTVAQLKANRDEKQNTNVKRSKNSSPFDKSQFYLYDVADNKIFRHILHFSKETGQHMNVTFQVYDQRIQWKGKAEFRDIFLVIVFNDVKYKQTYTHLLLKVEKSPEKIDLCTGLMTYIHSGSDSFISKKVLIHKQQYNSQLETGRFPLDDTHVHEQIRAFFSSAISNKLSVNTPVHSLDTLGAYYAKRNKINEPRYKVICGSFAAFYRFHPTDTKFVQDSLEISFDRSVGKLKIVYKHKESKKQSSEWIGWGFPNFNTNTISFHLRGPQPINDDGDSPFFTADKPMFLIINLPQIREQVTTVTGIILGNRDSDLGCVARLIVLHRKVKALTEIERNELNEFFNYFANRSRVRPPKPDKVDAIYTFRHLKDARLDAIRRQEIVDKG